VSALDVLAQRINDLTEELSRQANESPVVVATVSAVNPVDNSVTLAFNGGATLPAVPTVASYVPVVGHAVVVTLNDSQPIVQGVTGVPPGAPVTTSGVTVTGAVGSLLVEWNASTAPTMVGSRGMYQVQLDSSQTFDSVTTTTPHSPMFDQTVMATSIVIGSGLDPTKTYFVQVRAIDMYGTVGPWAPSPPASGSPVAISAATVITPGSITTPMLAAGAVTTDKIAANTITSGNIAAGTITAADLAALTLSVGQFIQSTNYVPTVSGWRVNADGSAEFNNVIVRGLVSSVVVSASQITTTEGVNLLANPSFETDLSSWSFGVAVARDNTHAYDGSWAARMTAGATGATPPFHTESATVTTIDLESATLATVDIEGVPGNSIAQSTPVAVTPGVTYEARCWWYYGGTATTIQIQVGIQYYDATGMAIGGVRIGKPFYPYHGIWVSCSSGGQVAPSNAVTASVVASFNGFVTGDPMWLDLVDLYATSTFIGQFSTSSSPNLPNVQIVDNDPTYGPCLTIADGRNAFVNLGFVSPAGKPTATLQGGAYDANVPKLTMIGGDGLGGASSVTLSAMQIALQASGGAVDLGNALAGSIWRALSGGSLTNPNGAVLWAADRTACQLPFTKRRASSALKMTMTLTGYSSSGNATLPFGLTPNAGTTLWPLGRYFFNTLNDHRPMAGVVIVTGVAAGSYTIEPYFGFGAGIVFNTDANDFLAFTVEEIN
jgi:hypothetical protein